MSVRLVLLARVAYRQQREIREQALLQAQVLELIVPAQNIVYRSRPSAPSSSSSHRTRPISRHSVAAPICAKLSQIVHALMPIGLDHLQEGGEVTKRNSWRHSYWFRTPVFFVPTDFVEPIL